MLKLPLFLLFLYTTFVKGQSHYPGQHEGKFVLKDKLISKVSAFDLQDVRLTDSRFKQNMEREEYWVKSLSVNRLLHNFRTNAGVYSGLEGGYDQGLKLAGWESPDSDLRGHTAGHILSGLALLYAATANETYKMKGDSLVIGLAEVQKVLNQNGYLSAYPQELINRNINGQRVWAPWYTLHKIFAGLLDQYLYCDNKQALETASRMADWAFKKLQPIAAEKRFTMLQNEFGGINETFYNLFAITGKQEYKWLGDFFYHDEVLHPLKEEKDILEKKHANTYIPKLLGVTRDYEIEGNNKGDDAALFFWNTVVDHHTFCTGSNSDKEHFFKPDDISKHLSGYTGESCNVYNMLKLTHHLFCHTGDIKYAEYYERGLVNHILGQQDIATGLVSYFLPMLPGAHKVYSTRDSSFWCCVGSGFENHAKYGEAIYYHSESDLYLNLFIPSEVTWNGFVVRQETLFPENGKSTITVLPAASGPSSKKRTVSLKIRYPLWAVNGVNVQVNGKLMKVRDKPGSYIYFANLKSGDKIAIDFPMSLRIIPTNDNPDKVAVAFGPILLAGVMGTTNFTGRQPFSDPLKHNDFFTYDYHVPIDLITSLHLDINKPENTIKPVAGKVLTFKVTKEGLTLRPLYDIHRERYVVYWDLKD